MSLTAATAASPADGPTTDDPALPELRTMWWETGIQARASASAWAVFTALPRWVGAAVAMSWRADRARTLLVAATTLAAGLMSTFGLLATQQVLIELFTAAPTPDRIRAALPSLILLAATVATRAGLGIVTGYAQNGLSPRVGQEVERRLFEVTTAVRLDAFDHDEFADDMERASRGIDSAVELVQGVMNLLAGLVSLVAVAVAVALINPFLLIALMLATVPRAWAVIAVGNLRYQTYVAGSVRRRRLWMLHRLMAVRASAAELRSYGLRDFLLNQYDRVMGAETRIQLDLAGRSTTRTTLGSLAGGLATAGVYALLAILLLNATIPLAAATTCVIALQAAQRSLTTITLHIDRVYTEGQHFGAYSGFLQQAGDYLPDAGGAAPVPPLRVLGVHAVSLTYPDRDRPAVRDVTLQITAGQTVAFVGENGSGKSTLAAIIAGLRTGTGVVTWNGQPFGDLDPEQLRRRIAVVSQEHHHWPFTAATNIALGDIAAPASPPRIDQAARLAAAHDMILELPHGYQTLLDRTFKDGQDLSGGQWQRITAARGFLRDAELLIMDEPSSALDPRAEHALFQAIRDRHGRATTVLITHRLANVRHADTIYVLDHGQLIESGTHDELMAHGGRYAELFTLQAAGYRAGTVNDSSP
jgi:ATP-binding cassette subfamily B protein